MSRITKERLQRLIRAIDSGSYDEEEIVDWVNSDEIMELARIALASLEAEPVACIFKHPAGRLFWSLTDESNKGQSDVMPVYTAPPAPVVDADDNFYSWFGREWYEHYQHNQYTTAAKQMLGVMSESAWKAGRRAAMLQGVDGRPELTVWYGAMPETNGKTNWTAMLHRKGHHPWEGITIDRSEYPGRVRYEADRMRHLIGELADEPDILAYDSDAHSGYVEPVTTAYKLRDAVEIIRNSGIEIDVEKIFAERDVLNTPDCWCRTYRPVTVTDMRFVVCPDCGNKRCPHANDHRNACTGSNEPGQDGSAYPAAPQQE